MGKIGIGISCCFYETDFDGISPENLSKLKGLYQQDKDKFTKYVYNALRWRKDPQNLFWGHSEMPYESVREYGNDGLNSIRVYEDGELVKEYFREVQKIKIATRKEEDALSVLRKTRGFRFIVGYKAYFGLTEFYTDLESDSFDLNKMVLYPSTGIDLKAYGGDISITPAYFIYDGEEYEAYDNGDMELLSLFGEILDNKGKVLYSSLKEDEDFGEFLAKAGI